MQSLIEKRIQHNLYAYDSTGSLCNACLCRIGVIHSVVFGFAPHELAIRIDDCKPRLIITASSGIEVDKLITYKPLVEAIASHTDRKKVIVIEN
jgi:acyl-coenzyme A synthetase/AMP-(fatty) acid ligase